MFNHQKEPLNQLLLTNNKSSYSKSQSPYKLKEQQKLDPQMQNAQFYFTQRQIKISQVNQSRNQSGGEQRKKQSQFSMKRKRAEGKFIVKAKENNSLRKNLNPKSFIIDTKPGNQDKEISRQDVNLKAERRESISFKGENEEQISSSNYSSSNQQSGIYQPSSSYLYNIRKNLNSKIVTKKKKQETIAKKNNKQFNLKKSSTQQINQLATDRPMRKKNSFNLHTISKSQEFQKYLELQQQKESKLIRHLKFNSQNFSYLTPMLEEQSQDRDKCQNQKASNLLQSNLASSQQNIPNFPLQLNYSPYKAAQPNKSEIEKQKKGDQNEIQGQESQISKMLIQPQQERQILNSQNIKVQENLKDKEYKIRINNQKSQYYSNKKDFYSHSDIQDSHDCYDLGSSNIEESEIKKMEMLEKNKLSQQSQTSFLDKSKHIIQNFHHSSSDSFELEPFQYSYTPKSQNPIHFNFDNSIEGISKNRSFENMQNQCMQGSLNDSELFTFSNQLKMSKQGNWQKLPMHDSQIKEYRIKELEKQIKEMLYKMESDRNQNESYLKTLTERLSEQKDKIKVLKQSNDNLNMQNLQLQRELEKNSQKNYSKNQSSLIQNQNQQLLQENASNEYIDIQTAQRIKLQNQQQEMLIKKLQQQYDENERYWKKQFDEQQKIIESMQKKFGNLSDFQEEILEVDEDIESYDSPINNRRTLCQNCK